MVGTRRVRRVVVTLVLASAVAGGLTGCIFRSVRTRTLDTTAPTEVRSPFKAHLLDGSVVVFDRGGRVGSRSVVGLGARYDALRHGPTPQDTVPLDSVVGLEVYQGHVNGVASAVGSMLGVAAAGLGGALLAVAIFGSCPTFYTWSDSLQQWTIQAEAFSTSVGPAFETRDVDRVVAHADADGVVLVEGRNEAAETHYLNRVTLVEVRHAPDELVLPQPGGAPIAAAGVLAPTRARDRAGRDVLRDVVAADGRAYATDPGVLAAVTETDFRDTVELAFPLPADAADSVALLFRMRNSLLTTVLLYDVIMGDQGPGVLDWFAQPRSGFMNPGATAYAQMIWPRVLVRDGRRFVPVAALNDAGPLAWRDVAVMIPVLERDSVVVQLAFAADVTRLDRVALGTRVRRPVAREVPVARVLDREGRDIPGAVADLASADSAYAVARPGNAYRLAFDAGSWNGARTFFLAATGYYVEWVRPSWFRDEPRSYLPTPERLVEAMRRWRAAGTEYEEAFYARRVPIQ
jgi:hypothetical protein